MRIGRLKFQIEYFLQGWGWFFLIRSALVRFCATHITYVDLPLEASRVDGGECVRCPHVFRLNFVHS